MEISNKNPKGNIDRNKCVVVVSVCPNEGQFYPTPGKIYQTFSNTEILSRTDKQFHSSVRSLGYKMDVQIGEIGRFLY